MKHKEIPLQSQYFYLGTGILICAVFNTATILLYLISKGFILVLTGFPLFCMIIGTYWTQKYKKYK